LDVFAAGRFIYLDTALPPPDRLVDEVTVLADRQLLAIIDGTYDRFGAENIELGSSELIEEGVC